MLNRFDGNVVPFASEATLTNRTVFGAKTQSDDIDDNLNADFKKGWEIVGLNDNPTREDFNAMGYTLGALTAYLYEMGIAEWNTSQKYRVNSRVIGSNGKIYKALTGTTATPNVGKNPTTDTINWEDVLGNYVSKTGNQTIADIKTFSLSPIVPTPTTNTQAANKQYVDSTITDRIGLIDYGYVSKSYHIVAFGGEFNRLDYPKLWAYLQANPTLVKTQAEWQTEATANNGICGFYSSGNGTTTFRVPNLDKAFLRPDNRGVGSFQEGSYVSGDHNITSPAPFGLMNYDGNTSNFRSRMNWDNLAPVQIGDSNLKTVGIAATSSNSYSDAPTAFGVTRPKNIAILPLIVAK